MGFNLLFGISFLLGVHHCSMSGHQSASLGMEGGTSGVFISVDGWLVHLVRCAHDVVVLFTELLLALIMGGNVMFGCTLVRRFLHFCAERPCVALLRLDHLISQALRVEGTFASYKGAVSTYHANMDENGTQRDILYERLSS